ncbi:folliculin-interacting protein 1 isoform X2 [Phymastichus coffea]|uniref:folliculin-interacting protein 1 isoform X2 n=1 Tax=Phymastichus coffea TaxID=108790 RepID=UPI00273CAB57|nr:folliculin-interacting protein 1 isoform X2 [Phymastichus coffea]
MSLIAKLWPNYCKSSENRHPNKTLLPQSQSPHDATAADRNKLNKEVDPVRILLFRECEWRARKLLFDSYALERNRRAENNNEAPTSCRNGGVNSQRGNTPESSACEHGKLLSEDISLLSEMIFGTVAMTYRGPSFKIHAMSRSPNSIMCTKVFPFSEHSTCRQSEQKSSETLGTSNSSYSSLRTQNSRSSGNPSGNSVSPTLRKNSTSSSTGSGWDIDIPRLDSSQSLDGNNSSSNLCQGGSLSSLRRRWLRVISTSLSRSESNDFGHNYEGSPCDAAEIHARKHKTRLGLALLLQLPPGYEQKISNKLLEHAALLEGVLDRLRHSCAEGSHGPERSLITRLYHASNSCTLQLLRLLTSSENESPVPLLWHDLLLNSALPVDIQVNTVCRSLQQMSRLLEEFDVKSTNFFLSTIVTAVLTHHLGWVHTAPAHRNMQLMETFGQQYPCNPLWSQLNDLYGALGTPVRISHTVIAAEPGKAHLIESVLNFLSYFLRSGLVEKYQETRCADQEDVQEAIATIERAMRKNPTLKQLPVPPTTNSKRIFRRTKSIESDATLSCSVPKSKSYDEPSSRLKFEVTSADSSSVKTHNFEKTPVEPVKKLKRSSMLQKNLSEFDTADEVDSQVKSKVKIIVNNENERQVYKDGTLRNLEKTEVDQKFAMLRRQKLNGFNSLDSNSKTFDATSLVFPATFVDDIAQQASKPQVYFTLGSEDKTNVSIRERLKLACKCQCSYTFTRVPSTSAELPEGVLRKILQRNFPESSKNMQPTTSCENDFGVCLKCRRGFAGSSQGFESKLMLETPTNATEVLRGCASSTSSHVVRSNSLEALIEASCVIELPMPRSKKIPPSQRKRSMERVGFTRSLLSAKTHIPNDNFTCPESGYTWGKVVQGFTKKKKKGRRRVDEQSDSNQEKLRRESEEWWWPIREGLSVEAKFPLIDQPVSEALCIIGDLDNWQVGLLSNTAGSPTPTPVGMSRLVSNMLEAFAYLWKEYKSPEQCIKLLESRLREMWLRSETLAEFLLAADLADASVGNLTSFLDFDAADLPLLLAVATTHSPRIAQRFGLTLA